MSGYSKRPLWPMWIVFLCAAVLLGWACGAGSEAFASTGWVRPVGGPTLLRYGDAYKAPGGSQSRAHSGVDLGCAEGDRALACEGGTVSFAGPVPGDAGGRVLAVTVTGDDGLRVTYMPLATAAVAVGQRVERGSAVGGVAGAGDASSSAPHLHLSVRRGEAYLDPAGMLAGAGGATDPSGSDSGARRSPETVQAPTGAPAPITAPQAAPSLVPSRVSPAGAPAATAQAGAGAPAITSELGAGAQAALTSLRAAHTVSPAAAVHAVTGRISLLSPMPASAALPVPAPHATGLAALTASWSSVSRALTLACAGLAIGLGALACAWRSLRVAAHNVASIHPAGALQPASTTPQRRA